MRTESFDVISSTELTLWHKYKGFPRLKKTLLQRIISKMKLWK